ncbi:hypothetical protein KR074_001033 [Drosophila pseudoananassae]|nr:hypothetical protein KR074_001033 [Drosophila pseudoananassae]
MGNIMDRKVSCAEARSMTLPPTSTPAALQEKKLILTKKENKQSANLSFHLFTYRQQMGCKKHQLLKWASSKLLLTEELLKLQKQPGMPSTSSWTNFDTIEVSDDDEDEDGENRAPAVDAEYVLEKELCHLKNYRLALRGTILEIAQEKMKKRDKKMKLKRLKRRTLISSKKPSNKDKYKQWQMPNNEHPHSQDNQPMDVIVID